MSQRPEQQVNDTIDTHSWTRIKKAYLDGLAALSHKFRADTDPNRTDLLVGVYKTDEGKAYLQPSVKEVYIPLPKV